MLTPFVLFAVSTLALVQGTYSATTQVCNNAAALCDRAYDNITHLGAHDSPFVRSASNGYTVAGDQYYGSIDALDAGVRLLSAQIHTVKNKTGGTEYHLCHTSCLLYDAGKVTDWLAGIKTWLDAHPSDVVTILLVNSDNLNATVLGGLWSQAGVANYGYVPAQRTQAFTPWPTLRQLISQNKRLLTFIASLDPASNTVAPYLLDEFTFIFETNYDNDTPTSFNCTANRPGSVNGNTAAALAAHMMPFMNHFLYDNIGFGIEISAPEHANDTNSPLETPGKGYLGDEADRCTKEYGRAPTYLFVDFFNYGPAIRTADRLNGVIGKTSGRTGPAVSNLGSTKPSTSVLSRVATATSKVSSKSAAVVVKSSSGASHAQVWAH